VDVSMIEVNQIHFFSTFVTRQHAQLDGQNSIARASYVGSSVKEIVPTGAYAARSATADAQPEYVIVGANTDSMYERLMRGMHRARFHRPNHPRANDQHRVGWRAEIEDAIFVAWTLVHGLDGVTNERDIVASEQVPVEDVSVFWPWRRRGKWGRTRCTVSHPGWRVSMPAHDGLALISGAHSLTGR
jgi:hypothetical protein